MRKAFSVGWERGFLLTLADNESQFLQAQAGWS